MNLKRTSLCDRVVALRNSVLILPVFIAFLSSSCVKETSLLGLGLVPPGDKIHTFYTDTITVYSSILKLDSISSYEIVDFVFGSYRDPVFGLTTANVVTQLSWAYAGFRYGPNPVADSVVMSIKYDYKFIYGNKGATLNFKVYEIVNEGFFNSIPTLRQDTIAVYSSKSVQPYLGNQIGQFSLCPANHPADTLVSFPLSHEFANKLIQANDTLIYDTAHFFHNYMKGICIIPDNANAIGDGYLFKTYYDANYIWVDVYFHNDTSHTYSEGISHFAVSAFNFDARVNTFSHDYSSCTFLTSLTTPTIHDTLAYIASMGGVVTKLSFPWLNNLKTNSSDIVSINRAELILPVLADDTIHYPPAELIQLMRLTSNGSYIVTPDYTYFSSAISYIDGIYDRYNRQYITQITKNMEYALTNKDYSSDLYIRSSTTGTGLNPEYIISGRSILKNGTGKNKIKLKITYTKR
jgi:hypothetical protein